MQTGFITALQPFGANGPPLAVRRADEAGQPPAEKLRDGQADRDRANDRATRPAPVSSARAGLVDGGSVIAAQESRPSEPETDVNGLTEEERRVIAKLKQRDADVRAHEAAHKAAAGTHAGGVSYTYQTGPDGRRYAVGGEVPIDVSPVAGDPRATIQKMQQIRRAALAPAEPSGADRAVAAVAAKAILQAQAELAAERSAELSGENNPENAPQAPQTAQPDAEDTTSGPTAPDETAGLGPSFEGALSGNNDGNASGADSTAINRPPADEESAAPSDETRPAPAAPDLPYLQPTTDNARERGLSFSIVA